MNISKVAQFDMSKIPSVINLSEIQKIEEPIGLIRRTPQPLENIELRAVLDKAVQDANLSTGEIFALNYKFFPNGGGFPLFRQGDTRSVINVYLRQGQKAPDEFTRQLLAIDYPDTITFHTMRVKRSKDGCFLTNYRNALKKLHKIMSKDR